MGYTKANLIEAKKGLKTLNKHCKNKSRYLSPKGNVDFQYASTVYGAVLKSGNAYISPSTGCYGGYNFSSLYAGTSLLFTAINKQDFKFPTKKDKDGAITMLNYLIKRSPFKGVILTKVGKEALEEGIIIDAFQPAAMVAGAFLNYKRIYNDLHGRARERFIKFKRLGVNEHLSYLLAVVLPASISKPEMSMGSGIYNSGSLHKDSVKNFANLCNDPDIKGKKASKSYHELGYYRSLITTSDTTVKNSFNVSNKTGVMAMTSLYSLARDKGVLVSASGGLYNSEEYKIYLHIDKNIGLIAKWAKEYYKWLH